VKCMLLDRNVKEFKGEKMIQGLAFAWASLCVLFFGFPLLYYLYMRRLASNPWNLNINPDYRPPITILVPAHNEEEIIRYKLENLSRLKYDMNLTQIILVDDASTDGTVDEVLKFVKRHPELNIQVIKAKKRGGKSRALNLGLKRSTGEVVIVSDADCFWPCDILDKALPYLADPRIGAICGRSKNLNLNGSWVIKAENVYDNKMTQIQIGESKLHSTVQFVGGFGAYKKSVLDKFDEESDDSGTALNIIQKNARTIVIPEAVFFTCFPGNWFGKIVIKTRRAGQLLRIRFKCLKLLFKRQLFLPKKIALPEMYLFVFNPIICLLLVALTLILLFQYPIFIPFFVLLFIIPKSRMYLVEIIQDNFIVLLALAGLLMKKRFVIWESAKKSKRCLNADILKKKGLI